MAFAEITGVRIHYVLTGDDDMPVLVLSNSLGVNLGMWEQQVEGLGSRFRLLRYDTRGHGQSSVPSGPYTMDDLGRDVIGLLDAVGILRASFCGISMGGMVGQWLALNAPGRLHKLILANTAAKIGNAETWNKRIETVLKIGLDPMIPGTLERWFTADFHAEHPETVAATAAMLYSTDVRGYTACCAAVRDADFRASISGVTVPTLVIAGTYDPVTSPEDGRFLAESIAGASYVELPSAHLSSVEAASEFNAALVDFLDT